MVLAGFMPLKPDFLNQFPESDQHSSALLPAFPGLDAQRQAWEYEVKFSGCSVHFVDEGVDTGPIIAQRGACPGTRIYRRPWPTYTGRGTACTLR